MSYSTLPNHSNPADYRGRIAPSPTGHLHLGHAQTFWIAAERARLAGGQIIFRNDDLDRGRCHLDYLNDAIEDLHWLKIFWCEGPDRGGKFAPYSQSERLPLYREALEKLHREKWIFPCMRSRKDVLEAVGAPHEPLGETDEPMYPKAFRFDLAASLPPLEKVVSINWRFRVPDDQRVRFHDRFFGRQEAVAGLDFGDFLVWRKDDVPAYQLACVVDDAAMKITEVVRGADLITSTFRQILLYQALGLSEPDFFHCPLVTDESGARLAKRNEALSLRTLRAAGKSAESVIEGFGKTYGDRK